MLRATRLHDKGQSAGEAAQSHLDCFERHGFSRAAKQPEDLWASALRYDLRIFNTSSAAKAGNIGPEIGTAKAVPFQTTIIRLISKARTLHFSLKFQMQLPWR